MPSPEPFAVPPGYGLLDSASIPDDDHFDWDAINDNPNLELWLIRMPNSLSAKHLESAALAPSSSRHISKLGELTRKETTYDIWSHVPFQTKTEANGIEGPICGEEMNSVTCLLPRRSKGGALYAASKPVARHVIITSKPAQPQLASSPESSESPPVVVHQNPPRQSYPSDLLKHRFMPYGSLTGADGAKADDSNEPENNVDADVTDVDQLTVPAITQVDVDIEPEPAPKQTGKKSKQSKSHEVPVNAAQTSELSTETKRKKRKHAEDGSREGKEKGKKKPKTKDT